jgi:hypothetical protein
MQAFLSGAVKLDAERLGHALKAKCSIALDRFD